MFRAVNINEASDPRDVIHEAVRQLSGGRLIGIPLETVYVLCAQSLHGHAVDRLRALADRSSALTLAVKDAHEAFDYVPDAGPLARKLARRCWPGPVTIEFPTETRQSLLESLPVQTRAAVDQGKAVRLRVPAQDAVLEILRFSPAPLVLSGENREGVPPAVTAADFQKSLGPDDVAMLLDDGPCRYGHPATVVRVAEDGWEIVEAGVVTETTLRRLASDVYLFVCTGNTCRSPMAEGMFRHMLAERLQCGEDELVDRGFVVASAGLSAVLGAPASPEAVELLRNRNIDLRAHESQPLTDRLLDQADRVFTMTRSHRDSILAARPDVADRVELLSRDGTDIADPMGGTMSDYEASQQQIETHLRAILEEIPFEQRQ